MWKAEVFDGRDARRFRFRKRSLSPWVESGIVSYTGYTTVSKEGVIETIYIFGFYKDKERIKELHLGSALPCMWDTKNIFRRSFKEVMWRELGEVKKWEEKRRKWGGKVKRQDQNASWGSTLYVLCMYVFCAMPSPERRKLFPKPQWNRAVQ